MQEQESFSSETKRQQKRQLWVILTISFLSVLGISIPYLIFPALFLNPFYSILPPDYEPYKALLLGVTLAAYPFGQFLGSPILGSLSDVFGRKGILASSLFIAALCNLLTGISFYEKSMGLLLMSRFAAGFMEGNVAIARAMAADLTTLSKHAAFGKINAAVSIAYILGPFLGGIMTNRTLFEYFTVATPFYCICGLFLFVACFVLLIVREGCFERSQSRQTLWERLYFFKRLSWLFSNQRLKFFLLTSTCFTLAADIFYEFGPVYLTVKWTLSPSQLISYNGVLCLGLAIGNGWLPHFLSARVSNHLAIMCAMGGCALFLGSVVWAQSVALMLLLFALIGLAIGLAVTLMTVKISNAASDDIQGEVLGVQLSLRVLCDAIICLCGGVLLLFSSKLILITAALISTAAVTYYALAGIRNNGNYKKE